MTRFIVLFFMSLIGVSAIAQNTDLSSYSYVVVPDRYEFLRSPDQYQLNSMTLFYLDKSGFNAYLSSNTPNANRCDGLYANVEELRSILGTKLQIVLRDCSDNEVYRSEVGKSKYKEFDKTYQDALRNAFRSMEALGVNQKDVVLLNASVAASSVENDSKAEVKSSENLPVSNVSGVLLPTSKFLNYSLDGQSFLLRKTAEGYSLYKETSNSEDGLQLIGKIVVMDKVVKYLDTSGNAADAVFDAAGNLTIKDATSSMNYKLID